jgi:hypothetical protein
MVPLQAVKDHGEGAKPWLMVRRTAHCLPALARIINALCRAAG